MNTVEGKGEAGGGANIFDRQRDGILQRVSWGAKGEVASGVTRDRNNKCIGQE